MFSTDFIPFTIDLFRKWSNEIWTFYLALMLLRKPSALHKLVLCTEHKYRSISSIPFYCHLSLQKKIRLGIPSFQALLFQLVLLFSLSAVLALKSVITLIRWQNTVYSKCHPRVTSEAHVLSDWVGVVKMDDSKPYFPKPSHITTRPNWLGRFFFHDPYQLSACLRTMKWERLVTCWKPLHPL